MSPLLSNGLAEAFLKTECVTDPSWAFVFPTTVLRIPYSLVCAVVWTGVVYYVTGLLFFHHQLVTIDDFKVFQGW